MRASFAYQNKIQLTGRTFSIEMVLQHRLSHGDTQSQRWYQIVLKWPVYRRTLPHTTVHCTGPPDNARPTRHTQFTTTPKLCLSLSEKRKKTKHYKSGPLVLKWKWVNHFFLQGRESPRKYWPVRSSIHPYGWQGEPLRLSPNLYLGKITWTPNPSGFQLIYSTWV